MPSQKLKNLHTKSYEYRDMPYLIVLAPLHALSQYCSFLVVSEISAFIRTDGHSVHPDRQTDSVTERIVCVESDRWTWLDRLVILIKNTASDPDQDILYGVGNASFCLLHTGNASFHLLHTLRRI